MSNDALRLRTIKSYAGNKMSVLWSERQRRTNRLVRKVANYLFQQTDISADQLYGLSQLTWITPNHYHDINGYAPYVESCKIPAFQRIFNRKYSSIKDVSDDVSSLLGDDAIIELINSETGFTNFYSAYRNSVLEWTRDQTCFVQDEELKHLII